MGVGSSGSDSNVAPPESEAAPGDQAQAGESASSVAAAEHGVADGSVGASDTQAVLASGEKAAAAPLQPDEENGAGEVIASSNPGTEMEQ
jgi:hypothetical protein